MVRGFNIPWVEGVDIPWVGGQDTMGRGVKVPWIGNLDLIEHYERSSQRYRLG
jgi:hypothetical protein